MEPHNHAENFNEPPPQGDPRDVPATSGTGGIRQSDDKRAARIDRHHVTGSLVITLDEDGAKKLRDLLTELLG